jgi:NAD(P)-dependent dehydrogenase (short-subunit alcohol dehydrogenase family)
VDLRYRLAVVTCAGTSPGREVAVALSRAGASVLAADPDLAAAEATAALVRAGRVGAWALQVDPEVDPDLRLLAARARDLGGTDLLVDLGPRVPTRLTDEFLDGLGERRGRRDGSPAVVNVDLTGDGTALAAFTADLRDPALTGGARVMAVVQSAGPAVPASAPAVTRAVIGLLSTGSAGQVVREPPSSGPPLPCR